MGSTTRTTPTTPSTTPAEGRRGAEDAVGGEAAVAEYREGTARAEATTAAGPTMVEEAIIAGML